MKNLLCLVSLGFILSISSCSVEETVALPENKCFNDDASAIEQLPWLKTVVSEFQKPKSGPVQVVLYVYNHEYAKDKFQLEYFIGVYNSSIASTDSYIYTCAGKTIGEAAINAKDFYAKATVVKVLFEGSY
ncbi:hypothetical protein [Cellulophaga sp. BC115SP]|uniref:hypothetical protein n=1 Tax=Cellulophaga sp. BC115SP TaxID=2683263 RepID=UPI001412D683|nr:hypothetical protein [Cellulophaga sp. BC115SP]NBB29223.1 hypothetical protein [Cellulophaga sp. BC115SP]